MEECFATAPPSVGNMAAGYDILGHALDAPGDQIHAKKESTAGVRIGRVTGVVTRLPTDPQKNTAGAGVVKLLEEQSADFGVTIDIHKAVALGSGMGGSASSAVAAVVAVNQLLETPLPVNMLLSYVLAGETVASGTTHGDNAAPSLLGGIIFVPPKRPHDFFRIPVPAGLRCVLVRPDFRLDTANGRSLLQSQVKLADVVTQTANLSTLLCACYENDITKLRNALSDVLIEPQRAHQITGFADVQKSAVLAGALGCTLSGSGPSIVAWCESSQVDDVCDAMTGVANQHYEQYQVVKSRVDAQGARILSKEDWCGV